MKEERGKKGKVKRERENRREEEGEYLVPLGTVNEGSKAVEQR